MLLHLLAYKGVYTKKRNISLWIEIAGILSADVIVVVVVVYAIRIYGLLLLLLLLLFYPF
jgi:hypothetical protein